MKKVLQVIIQLALSVSLMGQGYGNEWIDYSKTYYKIQVSEDGLYRISRKNLESAGIQMSSLQSNNVKMIHNGQEVPVYVHMVNGVASYIEFYGEKNRGGMDSGLYGATAVFNPEYSVISDSSAYFLSMGTNSKRYVNSVSNLSSLPQRELFYMHEEKMVMTDAWQKGKSYSVLGEQLEKSAYEQGEGWGSVLSSSHTIQMGLSQVYGNGQASVELRAYASGSGQHDVRITVNGMQVQNSSFMGDSVVTYQFQVNVGQLGQMMQMVMNGMGSNDEHSISYVKVNYARSFDFGGKSAYRFKLNAGGRKFLEITNFNNPGNGQEVYLYDMTNGLRIRCYWDGSKVLTDVPASSVNREMLLVSYGSNGVVREAKKMEVVRFRNYSSDNGDYVIIAHPKMFSGQGRNAVLEYAAYRSSTGYQVVAVSSQELYDQFGYGVNMHPMALRNFMNYVKGNWSGAKYVFLVGKARMYNEVRGGQSYDHLVPSFGNPASDNMLFSGAGSYAPEFAVGRLSITESSELLSYLEKVREMEQGVSSVKESAWRKRVLHMGGGSTATEQYIFSGMLNGLKSNLEGGKYGAEVHSFFRNNTERSEEGSSARMDSLISNGVSMITYLGHATPSSFEFNGYLLERYNNQGRYPLFLSLSCTNGSIFKEGQEMSERFVLASNKGAIAYIGFSRNVALSSANLFAGEFYRLLSAEGYGEGAGVLTQNALRYLSQSQSNNIVVEMAANSLIYHGDPGYRMNAAQGLDYAVSSEEVEVMPAVLDVQTEKANLSFTVRNLGTVVDTQVVVSVYRKYSNGDSVLLVEKSVKGPSNKMEMSVEFAVGGMKGLGQNELVIRVDRQNQLGESNEQNNVVRYQVQVGGSVIRAVYPSDFAMLPQSNINLIASTGDALAEMKSYVIELDTTDMFNSPSFRSTRMSQAGGSLVWTPGMLMDSVVYYWRAYEESQGVTTGVQTQSFIVIPGEEGWNQSHVGQFRKNKLQDMVIKGQSLSYNSNKVEVSVVNGYTPSVLAGGYVASFINNNMTDKCRCEQEQGVYVQVIDPMSKQAWSMAGNSNAYGAINCDSKTAYSFLFRTFYPSGQSAMESFLKDSIPAGHYVMMYTLNNAYASTWNNSLLSLLESYGSTRVRSLSQEAGGKPWAFFFKKGDAQYAHMSEGLAGNRSEVLTLSGMIEENWYKGSVSSPVIGPVKAWDFLDWKQVLSQNSWMAYGMVHVYGIDNNGTRSLLMSGIQQMDTTLGGIDAQVYPYLQLEWENGDSLQRVAPAFHYWRISSLGLGELVTRTDVYAQGVHDTVQRGQSYDFSMMIENVSTVSMDSVLVKYQVQGKKQVYYRRVAGVQGGSRLVLPVFQLPTSHLSGAQHLLVEINADGDQSEQMLHNNVVVIPFYVESNAMPSAGMSKTAVTGGMSKNYPNPFSQSTRFSFEIASTEELDMTSVVMEITDMSGRVVRSFGVGSLGAMEMGQNEPGMSWDGSDASGQLLPNGVYFYSVHANTVGGGRVMVSKTCSMSLVR